MDNKQFISGMAKLKTAFPNSGPELTNPAAMEVFFDKLKILDSEAWERAVDLCLSECEFFPSIARLLRSGARASSLDFSQEAERIASEVKGLVGLIGADNVDRAEKRVHTEAWKAINRVGGWKRWVSSMETEKDLDWSIKNLQESIKNNLQAAKDEVVINPPEGPGIGPGKGPDLIE